MTLTTSPMLALVPGTRTAPGTGANTGPRAHRMKHDYRQSCTCPTCVLHFQFADERVFAALHSAGYDAWLDHVWHAAACTRPVRLRGDIRTSTRHRRAPAHHPHDRHAGRRDLQALRQPARHHLPRLRRDLPPRRLPPHPRRAHRRQGHHPRRRHPPRRLRHLHRPVVRPGPHPPGPPAHLHRQDPLHLPAPALPRPPRRRHLRARPPRRLLHPPPPQTTPSSASRCARTATTTPPTWCGTTSAGELWRRTKQAIERRLGQLARRRGVPPIRVPCGDGKTRLVDPVRVAHGKAAEYQARGAVHFHALLRLDGYDPADPDQLLPPPPVLTVADLDDATRWAARAISYRTPPHPARPGGWTIGWGTEIDIRVITLTGTGTVTDLAVASYLAKYSTKGTEITGHASARITTDTIDLYANPDGTHPERLIHACWSTRRPPRLRQPAPLGAHARLRRPLPHQSPPLLPPFRDLRQARITYRRSQDTGPEHGPIRTADHADEETTLIVGTFTYAGTGWKTSGDALLANTAADQARKRREAGRDQLADEYAETMASEAA